MICPSLYSKVLCVYLISDASTAEFIIIDPLHDRRHQRSFSYRYFRRTLISYLETTMLVPYNEVNVYDPRYKGRISAKALALRMLERRCRR